MFHRAEEQIDEDDGTKTTRLIIVIGEFQDQVFFIYPQPQTSAWNLSVVVLS